MCTVNSTSVWKSRYYCKWSYRTVEGHYYRIRNVMNVHNDTNISFTPKKQHFIDKPIANDTTTIIKQLKLVIHELSSRTDEVSSVVKQVLLSALRDVNKDGILGSKIK